MSTRRRNLVSDEYTANAEEGQVSMSSNKSEQTSNIKGDELNIAILFFLYLLQGIPLGLSSAIPMYLQNRGVSYRQQAEFSFVNWPFSLKLLWAPIVDSWYSARFGRRKSWLVPTQYLIGLFMMFLSRNVDTWLGDSSSTPSIGLLTFFFFCLNFLAATQDIVVDGWALTMLKRCNVGHASTCNSVGQTAGYFLGYIVFMGLESAEFCNTYLRSTPEPKGLITLPGYLYFWAIVFLVTTSLVAVLKHDVEVDHHEENEISLDVKQTYVLLWNIVKLPAIRTTILVLLTCKIGFSACDAVTSLKLVDAGVPKEKLAMLALPMVPLQIILPLIISKYTAGSKPMSIYIAAIPYRLLFGLIAAFVVWITPSLIVDGVVPMYYYILLICIYAFHQVTLYSMFVAVMAFFARVSDPAVGGTYMTLLNTLSNLGGNWPATLALWLVDSLTYKECTATTLLDNTCSSTTEINECTSAGGSCSIRLDGYYIESLVCFVFGWLWLQWGRNKINLLQNKKESEWKVVRRRPS
ncbi:Acetyl-coenzyme A transporter 1 [Gryllus bimaculatus]|nr:Acetyl-coenzyme A transporter 1 [Gryllus bimaculatus]